VAEGAIRSGKTAPMSLSFVLWGMAEFNSENFVLTGKTIGSLRRNVIAPLKRMLQGRGIIYIDHRADNMLEVSYLGHTNYFYLFGGKDEGSQDLIQGITAAGLYCDEVALQPESFINQAIGRCSVDGAKLWFNCNPESPYHWFKEKWIDKAKDLGLYVLHFLMDDNPSLTQATKDRYKQLYAAGSIFYKRFILGLWCIAEGAIYNFLSDDLGDGYVVDTLPDDLSKFVVSIDYGQQHPTTMGLFGYSPTKRCWYLCKEHYTNNKPNAEYVKEFNKEMLILNGKPIIPDQIDIDPGGGGLSLLQDLRVAHPDMNIQSAIKIDVVKEIQDLSSALYNSKIKIFNRCKRVIAEMLNYVWDEKASLLGNEKPLKLNDDGPDMMRYAWNRITSMPMPFSIPKQAIKF
jgi:PBSX family phage terminase large subunit